MSQSPLRFLRFLRETSGRIAISPYKPRLNIIYNHQIFSDINRGAVTISITPYWRRRRLCGEGWTHPRAYTTVERLQIKQPRPKVRCSLRVNQAEKKSAKILTKQLKLNIFEVNRENRLRLGITLKLFAWRFCSRLALSLEKNKKVDSHDCPFQHIGT